MYELILNLHMHTCYSDGSGLHADLAQAALKTEVDVLLVSDHNVWVQGVEKYYRNGRRRVLLLCGEEIHDQDRDPQKNHLLVFGAERELATFADDPQTLIQAVRAAGGLSFIAHPIDPPLPAFGEEDISWVNWEVRGYTGIELWNGFSELKSIVRGKLDGLFYAYFPEAIARGPLPQTLALWDRLLASGQKVVAVGGSDAHARRMSLGPLHRVIFPYEYHFSAINTHLLVPHPLLGNLEEDKRMIYRALAAGHCFIGYDLPAPTRGFSFTAQGQEQNAWMGDDIQVEKAITLQVKVPSAAEIRLLKDGKVIRTVHGLALSHITEETGIYRVEVYRHFLGRKRGWIFSNPIYVRR
ncbi:MAG: CehA/McbA family metallohydrolase [Anaerolineales bacterium]|nr:CehA/McbA family metallohydrolase [Anaerolineales bacterium]MCX7609882.1 CehA/McbA family metallohydrolase [Anaerolineales bacterium]MDW8227519.1 CehA/McbA family metallohydrolase [Anaerolineales bacterium]